MIRISCWAVLLSVALFVPTVFAQDGSQLAGKRVVVLGDSITQNGAYVSFAAYYLEKLYPGKDFDIFGLGLSSETVSGLSEDGHAGGRFPRPCLFDRLDSLLEKAKPEVVFACYGMNDGIYLPLDESRFEAFQNGVSQLIRQCEEAGVQRIYLITPPIFDTEVEANEFNYDTVLTAYANWEMAIDNSKVRVIDLHSQMKRARSNRSKPFSKDHVHPGPDGHLFMAQAILIGLGEDVPHQDLESIQADPLFQQVNALRKLRSKNWMQHIGYTREKKVDPQPLADTEVRAAEIRKQIQSIKRSE